MQGCEFPKLSCFGSPLPKSKLLTRSWKMNWLQLATEFSISKCVLAKSLWWQLSMMHGARISLLFQHKLHDHSQNTNVFGDGCVLSMISLCTMELSNIHLSTTTAIGCGMCFSSNGDKCIDAHFGNGKHTHKKSPTHAQWEQTHLLAATEHTRAKNGNKKRDTNTELLASLFLQIRLSGCVRQPQW